MVSTIKNGIVANRLEAIRQKWPHDFMNGWQYCNNNVLMNVHNSLSLAHESPHHRKLSHKGLPLQPPRSQTHRRAQNRKK